MGQSVRSQSLEINQILQIFLWVILVVSYTHYDHNTKLSSKNQLNNAYISLFPPTQFYSFAWFSKSTQQDFTSIFSVTCASHLQVSHTDKIYRKLHWTIIIWMPRRTIDARNRGKATFQMICSLYFLTSQRNNLESWCIMILRYCKQTFFFPC